MDASINGSSERGTRDLRQSQPARPQWPPPGSTIGTAIRPGVKTARAGNRARAAITCSDNAQR
eukprot:850644-Rhodomonas_salina.1